MAAKKKAAKKKVSKKTSSHRVESALVDTVVRKKGTRKKKASQGSCFVLMPFREPFDTYYSAIIKPAVAAADLEPLRGDSLFTSTPIMGDVWKMIQQAKVLVAELTGKNPNVFYELGLGHAIGKPIVLISETMEDVPFDLQQLRVIIYDKDDPTWGNKLKNIITTSLNETLATPIEGVPPMFRKPVKSQAPSESEIKIRLDLLEQEVRALTRRRPDWRRSESASIQSLDDYRYRVHGTEILSVEDAIEFTSQALIAGIDPKVIFSELKKRGAVKKQLSEIMKRAKSEHE